MLIPARITLGMGGIVLCAALAQGGLAADDTRASSLERLYQDQPRVALSERAGRIRRVYGAAFSGGATALESAEAFRLRHAGIFGLQPAELVPADPHVQPVMFERAVGDYKFDMIVYEQQKDGVPVFESVLKLLVRRDAGHPLVLASADVHDLRDFAFDGQAARAPAAEAALQTAIARVEAISIAAGVPVVESARKVVWAGVDEMIVAPRLAEEFLIRLGPDLWLILVDTETNAIIREEQRVYIIDIVGSVEGRVTEGIGAEQCEAEVATPLPYLLVTAGANSAFTEADGTFVIPNPGSTPIDVNASLDGMWFDVSNFLGADDTETVNVTPPGPADILFNSANNDEQIRAQANGYALANQIRDYVLHFNPAYPALDETNFPVYVNRTDGFCPGNAWYDSGEQSINFCLSAGGFPNMAWSSVVHHEYGHRLVNAAGSGQGAYGEGTGDVMSVLLLDSPFVGWGFFGDCGSALRNADNNCQYSATTCTTNCGSGSHDCGRLMSGAVWSTREELVITEPVDYLDILSNIAINAILVHTGSSITPDIAVDYLTLDDDDADICNGTPHADEIAAGFGAHGLIDEGLEFTFPSGLPATVDPAGGTTVPVTVCSFSASAEPGTGILHVDVGAGFVEIPMDENAPNEYEAVFPPSTCGTSIEFYFSAENNLGMQFFFPDDAPASTLTAVSATSVTTVFNDDFESDLGWTVVDDPGLTSGTWERGVPLGGGDRGDPATDADGSSQCYVTEIADGDTDVDNGSTTLTSPVFDASNDPLVRYWRWFSNTQGNAPFQDIFVVEASDNGGTTWTNVETVGPTGAEVDGGWFQRQFLVSDVVTPNSQFRLRFIASDTDPQSVVEAGVDGVELIEIGCDDPPDCPWDCGDMDGNVGTADLLALLAQFGGPGGCDIDGSGTVTTADLLDMLSNWGQCP
jgi:hypothetical protein